MKKKAFVNVVGSIILLVSLIQIIPTSYLTLDSSLLVQLDYDIETESENEKESESDKESENKKDKLPSSSVVYNFGIQRFELMSQFPNTLIQDPLKTIFLPPPEDFL